MPGAAEVIDILKRLGRRGEGLGAVTGDAERLAGDNGIKPWEPMGARLKDDIDDGPGFGPGDVPVLADVAGEEEHVAGLVWAGLVVEGVVGAALQGDGENPFAKGAAGLGIGLDDDGARAETDGGGGAIERSGFGHGETIVPHG